MRIHAHPFRFIKDRQLSYSVSQRFCFCFQNRHTLGVPSSDIAAAMAIVAIHIVVSATNTACGWPLTPYDLPGTRYGLRTAVYRPTPIKNT